MKGSLTIVGLGPGAPELITPAVTDALKDSTDIVGYSKYIERVKDASGKSFHPSDNREEIDRAELSINLALQGKKVVVVSSGDPGVFAMASAIFEVVDKKNISTLYVLKQIEIFRLMFNYECSDIYFKYRVSNEIRRFCEKKNLHIKYYSIRYTLL